MTMEPEIVKILREEERLRASQAKSSYGRENTSKSNDIAIHESDDSTLLLESIPGQSKTLTPEHKELGYQAAFESCSLAILVLDTQKRIISWNSYTETLLNKTNVDLYLQSVASLHSTDEWSRIEQKLGNESGLQQQLETTILTKNKGTVDATVSLSRLKNSDGNNLGYLYLIKNISEQKQVEQQLSSIIQYADDSIFLFDEDCQYLMVNNSLLSRLRRPREDVVGKRYHDFHSAQETKEFTKKHSWVLEHGLPLKDVFCKDGNWYARTINPVKETCTLRTSAVLVIEKDITDANKIKEELVVEKENKYRTMFNVLPQVIILTDKKGTILDVNERITEWITYQTHEIKGINLFNVSFLTKESKKIIKKTFSKIKTDKKTTSFEIKVFTKNGKTRVGIVCMSPLEDDQGATFGHLLVISDITEQKRMDEAMRIKDSAMSSSPGAITFIDLQGNLTYVNDSFLRMWGYTNNGEVLGKSIQQFWKMKEQFFEVMDALNSRGEWIGELTGIRKDQSTFQVQLAANIIKNESGKTICIMGFYIDITQYKKSIKILNESQQRFQIMLENSLDMIYQFNIQKETYDYVSPSSVKVVGYSPEEMEFFTLKKIKDLIHPDDCAQWAEHLQAITDPQIKQNAVQSIEYRLKHKTRGYRWMRDTCTALFNQKNEPVFVVGTIEDVTERKNVLEELIKSEEKYRILAETSADGVFTTDALGRLTYINPSFEKLCGRRKSQILATPFRKYLLEDSVYFFQQIFIDVRKKNDKIENVELELVAGTGEIIPIEANIAPLTKQTEFGGVVCTVRDITQRREIEDELKKNERLKTEFMNIAAHELRSPVTPIKGYLDLILHDNESNEKIKNWAKISLRNAERLLKLVNDILDVARLDSDTMRFDMEKIDPVEFLNEIVEDMRPAITNKKLEFPVNIPPSLPHILGDKNRISQVLKNLMSNSLKFTDCGSIGLNVEKKDNHILITVEDTGIGISQNELKKIFTKFYQAYTGEDRNNEGTGLGLFISKEIIKKHNGTIWAESEVGKGSRFIIQLPYVYKMIVDFKT
jgi:PAS domain S-box-containing protein